MSSTMSKFNTIYFSATDTTRRTVAAITEGLGLMPNCEINLADNLDVAMPEFSTGDVALVAAPVYGGRLPAKVAEAFSHLKGNGTKAIAVVVYGNRDYDDALLELSDILRATGFNTVAAAASIGTHSIFPSVATGRPDTDDIHKLHQFGKQVAELLRDDAKGDLTIKGNRPYKKSAPVGLNPSVNKNLCVSCGVCADKCPVGAIPKDNPQITDADICISCGRCINVCNQNARQYAGLKYKTIEAIFKAAFSKRKEPNFIL